MVALLLKRNASWEKRDKYNFLPIDLALDKCTTASPDSDSEWVNTVSLLQLTALECETRDTVANLRASDLGISDRGACRLKESGSQQSEIICRWTTCVC
jgi:hypothetical protein